MGWVCEVREVTVLRAECLETMHHKGGKPWMGPLRGSYAKAERDAIAHKKWHERVYRAEQLRIEREHSDD